MRSGVTTSCQATRGTGSPQECPILGAVWERRSAVRCGQKRSDDVKTSVSTLLTCGNVPDQACCSSVLSVRDEEAAGSSLANRLPNRCRRRLVAVWPLPGEITLE
jgi:hypothetical protein